MASDDRRGGPPSPAPRVFGGGSSGSGGANPASPPVSQAPVGQRGPRRQRAQPVSPAPGDEYLVHVYDGSAPDAFLHVVEKAWPGLANEDVTRWTENFKDVTGYALDATQMLSIALADYLFIATKKPAAEESRASVPALGTWVAIAVGFAFASKKKRHRLIHAKLLVRQEGVDEQRLDEAIDQAKRMSPNVDGTVVAELSDR